MKRKFSNSQELHEFMLSQLQSIVGVGGCVKAESRILHYQIIPNDGEQCIWQTTLRKLFKFFTKYKLSYYIDFQYGYYRVYTSELIQKALGRL